MPGTLLITADEETTKQGARAVAAATALPRALGLEGIIVAEPTGLVPVRGHRSHIDIHRRRARGVQAHSSTGQGDNANWALMPFLAEMKAIFERLRDDPALQDAGYDPPFSDFNLIVDNHGTAVNVTVAAATRASSSAAAAVSTPAPILAAVRGRGRAPGSTLTERARARRPNCRRTIRWSAGRRADRPGARAPRPTAPMPRIAGARPLPRAGPGTIATAHTPHECVAVADLAAAVPLFGRVLAAGAGVVSARRHSASGGGLKDRSSAAMRPAGRAAQQRPQPARADRGRIA